MIAKEHLETIARAHELEFPNVEFVGVDESSAFDLAVIARRKDGELSGCVYCRRGTPISGAPGKAQEIRGLFEQLSMLASDGAP